MEKLIRTGIASYGMSGQLFHAPFIETNPHFELHTIVERSKSLSKARYPKAVVARSIEEMLADNSLELVVINTPDSTHYTYVRQALEAGKNVIVEKPFTTTTTQADELVDLATQKGLMLSVYQNRRWDADFLTVKEIMKKGETLGRLVEFESTMSRFRNFIKPDTWKETGASGGGMTYNLGAHLIDQALQLFGTPESVYAEISTMRRGGCVDDYFRISLLHPSRCPELRVMLKAGYLMCWPAPRFVLNYENGSFIKYGNDPQEEALQQGKLPNSPHWGEEQETYYGILTTARGEEKSCERYKSVPGNYMLFYENIYEHLRLGKPLLSNASDVIDVIRIIEAAYLSSKEERVVRI
jgi:predicted dehydrogenase